MDGAKAGSLNDWERVTWPEENRKSKTRRESNHPPMCRTEHGLEVKEAFRVNVCLPMMLDQRWLHIELYEQTRAERVSRVAMSLSLNLPNLSRGDFLQNASHGVQIQIGNHSYQITKVIYKVTNSHLLFVLFVSIFGNAVLPPLWGLCLNICCFILFFT